MTTSFPEETGGKEEKVDGDKVPLSIREMGSSSDHLVALVFGVR